MDLVPEFGQLLPGQCSGVSLLERCLWPPGLCRSIQVSGVRYREEHTQVRDWILHQVQPTLPYFTHRQPEAISFPQRHSSQFSLRTFQGTDLARDSKASLAP